MSYFFPGMIVGVILLQTASFAATRFRVLNEESAGKLICALFPSFSTALDSRGLLFARASAEPGDILAIGYRFDFDKFAFDLPRIDSPNPSRSGYGR